MSGKAASSEGLGDMGRRGRKVNLKKKNTNVTFYVVMNALRVSEEQATCLKQDRVVT